MKIIKFIVLCLLVLNYLSAFAQTFAEMNESRLAERKAVADYRAKNFPSFLENMRKANDLRPNHSRLIYNLAIAYALNNQPNESLNRLEQLVKMGLAFQIEKDDDFKSLFENKRFKQIQQQMNRHKLPVNNSKQAFSLKQKDLITEGIAYNPKTKTFYISSIHQRKIIAVKNSQTQDFSTEADGLWSVSGMRVDAKRQILWVCSSAFPQMKGFKKEDDGKAGIFKYDLKTGKLLKKYLLSNESEKHALGDLVLNKKGDVFATDSISPYIYFIDSKTDKLEIFVKSDLFSSLQGAAFTPDEKTMVVADYGKGIFKIEMQTKQITQLKPASNVTILGLDGFYWHRGKLIAIQNGINPQRVVSFTMNPQMTQIIDFETLEANHPNFNEPTLGVIIGNELFYIANSQWELVNEKAELQSEKLKNPVILKLKL
jgi:hypothetical protein